MGTNGAGRKRTPAEWWTFAEALKYLGVSRNTLYGWVAEESVPHHWFGGRIRFVPEELETWSKR